jgi:hypothetical protein
VHETVRKTPLPKDGVIPGEQFPHCDLRDISRLPRTAPVFVTSVEHRVKPAIIVIVIVAVALRPVLLPATSGSGPS